MVWLWIALAALLGTDIWYWWRTDNKIKEVEVEMLHLRTQVRRLRTQVNYDREQ